MTTRSGTENRQRQKIVAVRLNPREADVLAAATRRECKPAASLLRDAFLEREIARVVRKVAGGGEDG